MSSSTIIVAAESKNNEDFGMFFLRLYPIHWFDSVNLERVYIVKTNHSNYC